MEVISPFDYVKSINAGKNIMRGTDNDSLMERDYNAFIAVSYTHLTLPTKA